jgi:hypothetical protein
MATPVNVYLFSPRMTERKSQAAKSKTAAFHEPGMPPLEKTKSV